MPRAGDAKVHQNVACQKALLAPDDHIDRSAYETADSLLLRSLTLRTLLKDSAGMAAVHNKRGIIFQNRFMLEEALEYAGIAFEQTDGKPIFLFYKSAVLFAMGKSKEALLHLETAMNRNPKLVKKFIEINPALLQLQQVVDVIARYKKRNSL